MTPAAPEPAELTNRLRQQLILAQVRIMELEDVRDTLTPRITELDKLLRETQQLADTKLEENRHLSQVLAATQQHAELLQEQLDATARALAAQTGHTADLSAKLTQQEVHLDAIARAMKQEQARNRAAEAEIARLKSTRSWRWSAWLRAIEKRLG